MKLPLLVLVTLLLITAGNTKARKGNPKQDNNKRIALVVGVANYKYAMSLQSALHDATGMDSVLSSLGFHVKLLLDPDLRQMNKAVDEFALQMKDAKTCLFYFSGHGAEYKGKNYMFLKSSNPQTIDQLSAETFALNTLLDKCNAAKIKTTIIFLDACRNNPLSRMWADVIDFKAGLTHVNVPAGTFIGFAASPGETVYDGMDKNSIFTGALIKNLAEPGISIDQLFTRVNKMVRGETNGNQIPFKSSSLYKKFIFHPEKQKTDTISMTKQVSTKSQNRKSEMPQIPSGVLTKAAGPL